MLGKKKGEGGKERGRGILDTVCGCLVNTALVCPANLLQMKRSELSQNAQNHHPLQALLHKQQLLIYRNNQKRRGWCKTGKKIIHFTKEIRKSQFSNRKYTDTDSHIQKLSICRELKKDPEQADLQLLACLISRTKLTFQNI